ncbi:hypothetical protein SAMN04488109_1203 [Chryseolinea serpens]|uniref:Uncharacterized protein n=1 Tax=Chryseolinea serpens TaxID=947013 RepID=A0A1M5LGP9_9BACT|nr:hypothetical protein [Chryseolinea serpens]SHG64231.1 hypothetical protein SAMN04488109_1203 [Chryseolinea serpens]
MSSILKIALAGIVLAALGTAVFLSLREGDTVDTTFVSPLQTKVVPHSGYVIDLPSNYSLKENTGPDFSVFYFKPIDTTSIPNFYGGFYLGNYPSRFSVANNSCSHAPLQAPLFNALEEWTLFDCMNGFSSQAIGATNTKDGWDTYVHAFGHGADDEALHKLVTIFATLRKKEK